MKAWDYARTFFRSERLQIAYINAKSVFAGNHNCWCFEKNRSKDRLFIFFSLFNFFSENNFYTDIFSKYVASWFWGPLPEWNCYLEYHLIVYIISSINFTGGGARIALQYYTSMIGLCTKKCVRYCIVASQVSILSHFLEKGGGFLVINLLKI